MQTRVIRHRMSQVTRPCKPGSRSGRNLRRIALIKQIFPYTSTLTNDGESSDGIAECLYVSVHVNESLCRSIADGVAYPLMLVQFVKMENGT